MVFAEFFFKRQNSRRFFEQLQCHEEIKIANENLCFLVCLHFPIGRDHHSGVVPGSPQCLHPVCAQILFAQDVSFLWRFSSERRRYPCFGRRVECSFVPCFGLVNISRQSPMLLCGRIVLGARFCLVSSPQTWRRMDCAHEVFMTPRDGFVPQICGATCPWKI